MAAADHARHVDRADLIERLAVEDRDLLAVADIEELLLLVRRQRDAAGERRVALEVLLEELAVVREHLDALVLAVGDIDEAIIRDAQRVHDRKLRRAGRREAGFFHNPAMTASLGL